MASSVCKNFLNRNLLKVSVTLTRFASSKGDSRVVVTDDTSVIVCWHPEKFFPYELSRPVEKKIMKVNNSVLKVQSSKELLSVLKPKNEDVVRKELMAMTHTPKHIWFPRKFQFRRKPMPEKSRPYL